MSQGLSLVMQNEVDSIEHCQIVSRIVESFAVEFERFFFKFRLESNSCESSRWLECVCGNTIEFISSRYVNLAKQKTGFANLPNLASHLR